MFIEIPASKKSLAFRKPIYGVGINDAPYMVQIEKNKKRITCKYYATWKSMFVRCYSEKYKERFTSYGGCSVSNEWWSFMNFKAWMQEQNWKGEHLDKDLLSHGNKVYSKNDCLFVPPEINMLLTDSAKARGKYPVGVGFHKAIGSRYASCGINGSQKHLGYFETVDAAFTAYKIAKHKYIMDLSIKYKDRKILSEALIKNAQRVIDMKAV